MCARVFCPPSHFAGQAPGSLLLPSQKPKWDAGGWEEEDLAEPKELEWCVF